MKLVKILALVLCLAAVSLAQESNYDLGFSSYQKRDFQSATEYLQKAIEESPQHRVAWLYLGFANLHLGKKEEADSAFETMSRLEPKATIPKPNDKSFSIKRNSRPRSPRKHKSGRATVLVELKADGRIGLIYILDTTVDEWRRDLLTAAQRIKFTPAERSGVPATTIAFVEYTFQRS